MKCNSIKIFIAICATCITSLSFADNGKPDLWKVEKNGTTSYLFGSIHMGSQDMYPLSDAVKNAYTLANKLAVEIDLVPGEEMKLMPLIQKHGLNMTIPLEKRLSADGLATYQQACKEKALPCNQFSPYRGWMLSAQLAVLQMQKLGYKEDLGIDKHFLALAHKSNKPVLGLETAEMQFGLLGGLDQNLQELMLIQTLQATDEEYKSLFKAWKTGDDQALTAMFQKGAEDPKVKAMYLKIFDQRNFKMAEKIANNSALKQSLFVVVGAGHMIGKNGLVDLLAKKGFKITQVQ